MAKRDNLFSIEKVIELKSEELLQIRTMIVDQNISNYPIFVFQKPSQTILGKKIIDQSQSQEKWNVFITHLEELYHKKIVVEDKLDDFKFQYKNNNDKYCILLIENEEEYSFLFTPIIY
ncbi:MAG: hypothetical protein JNL75_03595 [Chitinophagales bacterium]|nr:hypothetical protein [Chitinophagales bacterium]